MKALLQESGVVNDDCNGITTLSSIAGIFLNVSMQVQKDLNLHFFITFLEVFSCVQIPFSLLIFVYMREVLLKSFQPN